MKDKVTRLFSFLTVLTMVCSPAALADENIMALVQNLQGQMAEMQKTIQWQGDKIRELQGGAQYIAPAGEDAARVVTEKTHPWMKDLTFYADSRLRYEGINTQDNTNARDRNRFRFRLRFGFEKELPGPFDGDQMQLGMRLVSGDLGGITSTNTTFDSNFGHKDLLIDRVWAKYKPGALQDFGILKKTEIVAGKMKNVHLKNGSTWVVWDSDVNPEGMYERFELGLFKNDSIQVDGDLIFGQYVLEEGSGTNNDDSEMFAYAGGLKTQFKVGDTQVKTKHYVTYYDYSDYANAGNFTAGNNPLGGTSLAAADFNMIDIYNEVGFDLPGLDLPFSTYFDWVKNAGESAPTKALGGGQDKAWMAGAKIGKAKKKGSWELKYEYAWIEANAVPGAFTDSDFNSGGGDSRGSVIKGAYALTNNLKLGAAAFFTNRILTGAPGVPDAEQDMFQLDLVWNWG